MPLAGTPTDLTVSRDGNGWQSFTRRQMGVAAHCGFRHRPLRRPFSCCNFEPDRSGFFQRGGDQPVGERFESSPTKPAGTGSPVSFSQHRPRALYSVGCEAVKSLQHGFCTFLNSINSTRVRSGSKTSSCHLPSLPIFASFVSVGLPAVRFEDGLRLLHVGHAERDVIHYAG